MRKKIFRLSFLLLTCVLLSACSKGAADDLKTLLKSVPADAVQVGVANVESLGDQLSENRVQTDNLKKIIAGNTNKTTAEALDEIFNGKAGAKTGCMVYFEGSHSFLTGLIEDPKAFTAFVGKFSNVPVTKEGDFSVSGNVAFTDRQFWIQTTGSVDVEELTSLTRLTETQSFLSVDYAERMLNLDHDIVMLTSFRRALQMSGQGGMQMNILSAALFDDAQYVAVTLDLTGDKKKPLGAEITAEVLNSGFKPAKFLLPTATISVEDLTRLDGRGEMVLAMAVNPKMVDKIAKMAASFGGSLPKNMLEMLKCLDGTMALSSDLTNSRGFIRTKKGESEKLAKYLYEIFPANRPVSALGGTPEQIVFTPSDREVKISQGILPAGLEITKIAPEFKGAMFGLMSDSFSVTEQTLIPFDGQFLFTLVPENGSLKARIRFIGDASKGKPQSSAGQATNAKKN